jgi:Icc-related predicted phosphoesterase
MIRIAAVGDLHVEAAVWERWRDDLDGVSAAADVLLLAGDLTQSGSPDETRALVAALARVTIPIFAVLGNHDYEANCVETVGAILGAGGVALLEGAADTRTVRGERIGIAGVKGFGGGFVDACGSEFGEPEMKAFIAHTRRSAERLYDALRRLEADVRVALLHYAPVQETLRGERVAIHAFLGSHLLGDAIDAAGADLVLHGHAHGGTENGVTPGGIRVCNVAQPVIRCAYRVIEIGKGAGLA